MDLEGGAHLAVTRRWRRARSEPRGPRARGTTRCDVDVGAIACIVLGDVTTGARRGDERPGGDSDKPKSELHVASSKSRVFFERVLDGDTSGGA